MSNHGSNCFLNQRGGSIVVVLAVAILANMLFFGIYFISKDTLKRGGVRKTKTSVFNIAEAGKEKLYSAIRDVAYVPQPNVKQTLYSNTPFAKGTFTVSCSANVTTDSLWIVSSATEGFQKTRITVLARLLPEIPIPGPPVRGAITARSNVDILGNIVVDGRDYNKNGVLVGSGVFGVSTCSVLSIEGSSTVGGNGVAPVDKMSVDPVRTTVVEENAPVSNAFTSPEQFLGVSAGSLNAYKVNSLSPPFNGLYYVTNDLGPIDLGNSSGILIVHNEYTSAQLRIANGNFKGIIIADKMDKINGTANVLGAVVTLIDGQVSTFGNGSAVIRYSSDVLLNLEDYCRNMWKKVDEISWKQE